MNTTIKNIIQLAQSRGSKSATKSGARKYLIANLPGAPRPRGVTPHDNGPNALARHLNARMRRRAEGRARALGYSTDNSPQWMMLMAAYAENQQYEADARTQYSRSAYGEIIRYAQAERNPAHVPDARAHRAAQTLINAAAREKLIRPTFDGIEFDRRGRASGHAIHHEMYDRRDGSVIVCVRAAEGTRYGVKTNGKTYFYIERIEDDIAVTEIDLPVAKFAKSGATIGSIIARYLGEEGGATLPSAAPPPGIGYKAVALVDGVLRSIFSGEKYFIGSRKSDSAMKNHRGGYYFYATPEEALSAEVPDTSALIAAPRVIVRCEVAGREIRYGKKIARTHLCPIEVVAHIK